MTTNIGTGPQDIPLNQFLGEMAFMDNILESGAWTPAFAGTTVAGTMTQPNATYQTTPKGTYQRIGNMVFARARFFGAALSGGSGFLVLDNLPYKTTLDVRWSGQMNYLEGVNFVFNKTLGGTHSPGGVVIYGGGQNSAPYFRPAFSNAWDAFVDAGSTTYTGGAGGMHGSITLTGWIQADG